MSEKSGLSERQIMIMSHLVGVVLRDIHNSVKMVEEIEQEARKLGATDEDIAHIVEVMKSIEGNLKEGNKYGWW